ncbi:hypothetical protein [Streptomyces sp. NPDC056987]|uniref:hypothetical protein n=1 Tax=Streptomyces sp. NPDC056987 TaxID=3345988 RepID=UPI003638DE29
MSEPNPYADGEYKWGPAQQSGTPAPGTPGPGTPAAGAPQYDFPPPTLADGQSFTPPGYGYPPQAGAQHPVPMGGQAGAPLVTLGDITVVGDSIITPSGTLPLRGAVWNATDMSRTEEKIPTHAIILAIIFFIFCLLGLLFLLMKEKTTTGFIQVTVTSGGKHHAAMIPAHDAGTFQMVMSQISYARSLSAM